MNKRFTAILLSLIMTLTLVMPALADEAEIPVVPDEISVDDSVNSVTTAGQDAFQGYVQQNSADQKTSNSGIAGALGDFYRAVSDGEVSEDVVSALNDLTSEEMKEKKAVVDSYENLGIARPDGYLNVREKASTKGKIIGKMVRNAACEIIGEDGDWYQIKSGSVKGYVSKQYIVTGEEAKEIALDYVALRLIVTTKSNLNVRKSPSTDAKVVDKIATNERYPVEEDLGDWIKIHVGINEDGEDIYGYVSAEYTDVRYCLREAVEFTPVDAKTKLRQDICNYALRFLGNRYVFGGTSLTKGTDCSGFTMGVYGHFGIKLPHSAASQAGYGKRVSSSQMQPGDLIFFTYGSGRICHVGIYIGNGKMIHAANSKLGIIISRWNSSSPARIISLVD